MRVFRICMVNSYANILHALNYSSSTYLKFVIYAISIDIKCQNKMYMYALRGYHTFRVLRRKF